MLKPVRIQNSQGKIDRPIYKILISSLIALGLNPPVLEQREKLHVNEQALRKINQKVGDFLLHFLLVIINPQHASKAFRDCWPIYDKKAESQFRNACYEWLKQLCQNDEFNLKPVLVVSKATVAPTSQKFIKTLQTLTRIALYISISRKAPRYVILHFPSLANTAEHRIVAMKIIKGSKVFHFRQFSIQHKERLKKFQSLQEKSNQLVGRYRSLVSLREEVRDSVQKMMSNSSYINEKIKNKYQSFHLLFGDSFRNEFEFITKEKNKEIKELWSDLEGLQNKDEMIWPFLSSLISGDIGLTCIDGSSYKDNISQIMDDPIIAKFEKSSLYIEEKLDLILLFKLFQAALQLLLNKVKDSRDGGTKDDHDEIKRLQKCSLSLFKNFKEIAAETLVRNLRHAQAAEEIREKLTKFDDFFQTKHQDIFDLCPPTPPLQLVCDSDTTDLTRPDTSLTVMQLTPSGTKSLQIQPRKLCNDGISPNLNQLLLRRNHLHAVNIAISPNVLSKKMLAGATDDLEISNNTHSSIHQLTQDSGCILGPGSCSDSLSHSLEKINITPKYKHIRNFGSQRDSFEPKPENTVFEDVILSPIISTIPTKKPVTIKRFQGLNNDFSSTNGKTDIMKWKTDSPQKGDNLATDIVHSLNLPFTPQRLHCFPGRSSTKPIISKEKGLVKVELFSKSQNHNYKNSPVVSKLLTELKEGHLNLPSNHSEFKLLEKKESKKGRATATFEKIEKSGNIAQIISLDSNMSSVTNVDKSNIHENYSMCMSSLESMLGLGNCTNYNFNADLSSTKDLIYHNDMSVVDKSEKFFDSSSLDAQYLANPTHNYLLSNLLPSGSSVFGTLTDAITSGELEQAFVLNEEINEEVRRESLLIPSRKESILSLGQCSEGQSPRLSEAFQLKLRSNFSSVLDESDSCLLDLSIEDF